MKSGPGDLGARDLRLGGEIGGEPLGERARVRTRGLGFLRIDHRRVGREVAVGGIARRLDDEAGEVEAGGQVAGVDPLFDQRRDAGLEIRKKVHAVAVHGDRTDDGPGRTPAPARARPTPQRAAETLPCDSPGAATPGLRQGGPARRL